MNSTIALPELLLPAGGFDSAIASIEGGADALYLGFSEFSARMQARNFDRLEYRRLHRFARGKGVRLYVALNTILLDGEVERAASLLAFLGRFPPDAVLVQDWGLARLMRERYPGIAIHASTQTAAQGVEAARIAKELGAVRLVLPRETSLAEMRRLREDEPGLEYEAFVHGALCYSYSGLCLASGLVLGRSGNRGECAQLCRSYYEAEGLSPGNSGGRADRGYWFSCRDLELAARVGELASAGIASLKVEGRMKGPEYCYAVARFYRAALDGIAGKGPDEAELEERKIDARTAFSRSPTEAWLFERGGASLIDPQYPGHRGVRLGRIRSVAGKRLVVDLERKLCLRDGLLGFEEGDPFRPLRFSATALRDARTGRDTIKAAAGSRIELEAPLVEGRQGRFEAGQELYKISSREQDRRAPSPEEYEAEKEDLALTLKIDASGIGAEMELPNFGGAASGSLRGFASIERGEAIPLEKAKSPGGFARALAVFAESGGADFTLVPEIEADLAIRISASPPSAETKACGIADLFIPPSILKREKNRIYSRAAELISEAEIEYARDSAAIRVDRLAEAGGGSDGAGALQAPPRSALVFPRADLPTGMPFATMRDLAEGSPLPSWGGRSWLPLAPLVGDRGKYAASVRERLRKELEEGKAVVVGLGALHHIALARDLSRQFGETEGSAEAGEARGRLSFFLDVHLYVANALAFASLSSLLPGVEFAYGYIEAEGASLSKSLDGGARIAPVGEGFEPPLFQSLGCAFKHHLRGGACPDDCPRDWAIELKDRERRYRLIVEDCVTMLFRLREGRSR